MSAFTDAIDELMARVLDATEKSVEEGAARVRLLARDKIHNVSYRLSESILTTGPSPTGAASFEAQVGPTVVYGRIHELGGVINPHGHPYLAFSGVAYNTANRWGPGMTYMHQVTLKPQPYMLPAVYEVMAQFDDIFSRRVGEAILTTLG